METYPASPKPAYGITTNQKHRTLISGSASGGELRRRSIRFPKRNIGLLYNYLTITDRNIIQNFFKDRDGSYEEFWYVDYQSKHWHDEYVGRGGPLELTGCFTHHAGVYTNYLVAARNDTEDDINLFSLPPYIDDADYFGGSSQFDVIKIILSAPGEGTWTLTYEYWNGAWTSLAGVVDDSTGFTALGDGTYADLFDDADLDTDDPDEMAIVEAIRLAFEKDTVPVDWVMCEINGVNAYWVRARLSAFTSYTVLPVASMVRVNSKTYDLHGVTTSGVSIYVDGVVKTAGGVDYTFVSGGGGAAGDRVLFADYPDIGDLITSDFTGFLRLKCRFADDELGETDDSLDIISLKTSLQEVQW
jgi:hypothetical protein